MNDAKDPKGAPGWHQHDPAPDHAAPAKAHDRRRHPQAPRDPAPPLHPDLRHALTHLHNHARTGRH